MTLQGFTQVSPVQRILKQYPVSGLSRAEVLSGEEAGHKDLLRLPVRTVCKGLIVYSYIYLKNLPLQKGSRDQRSLPGKDQLLKVHGNVLYDVNYWSNIDTPYAEKSVYQQMLQTYLDIDYKDNYPFRFYFTTHWSNSSLFRNFSDVNFLYNATEFNNRVRRQVQGLLQQHLGQDTLLRLEKELKQKQWSYDSLKYWLSDPSQLQRLASEREKIWLKGQLAVRKAYSDSLKARDTLKIADSVKMPDVSGLPDPAHPRSFKFNGYRPSSDSGNNRKDISDSSFAKAYDSAKARLDSLAPKLAALQQRYQQLKSRRGASLDSNSRNIDNLTSGTALHDNLKSLDIPDSSLPKGYKTLYSVRSFGIGRAMLNYSELSAKNVSINGLEVEYNPSWYAAFAVGTVDYRFRDYTLQNPAGGQYIALARYGWGKVDGNSLIFTYYTGRRQLYNSYTTPQGTDIPNYNLMGFTVEGRYKLGRTTTFIAEVAKSSSPYYSLDTLNTSHVLSSALKFSDHSNEAWSLKLNSFLPVTQTQLSASYSHYGANFQSFSLFTTGSEQKSWSVKADQPFFKRQLLVTASIRTNDFTNPLLNADYQTTALFESLQATLRLKKWPTISLGYFPSSQIVKLGDGQYQENLFYTLTANVSHSYKTKGITMISMLMYTQFYNKLTDSSFVYYNTRNLLLSQSAFLGRFTAQLQMSLAASAAYNLYVLDGKMDYRITSWLSLGAGVKYNQQTVYSITQWGYSGDAAFRVPKFGELRFVADKGFIPGDNKQLVPNNTGRLTYSKVF
jgi:hypothetical protein